MTEAEIMRLWRECGLPEYFLGNGGSNHKLVAFARALLSPHARAEEVRAEERERCAKKVESLMANYKATSAFEALGHAAHHIRSLPSAGKG